MFGESALGRGKKALVTLEWWCSKSSLREQKKKKKKKNNRWNRKMWSTMKQNPLLALMSIEDKSCGSCSSYRFCYHSFYLTARSFAHFVYSHNQEAIRAHWRSSEECTRNPLVEFKTPIVSLPAIGTSVHTAINKRNNRWSKWELTNPFLMQFIYSYFRHSALAHILTGIESDRFSSAARFAAPNELRFFTFVYITCFNGQFDGISLFILYLCVRKR